MTSAVDTHCMNDVSLIADSHSAKLLSSRKVAHEKDVIELGSFTEIIRAQRNSCGTYLSEQNY